MVNLPAQGPREARQRQAVIDTPVAQPHPLPTERDDLTPVSLDGASRCRWRVSDCGAGGGGLIDRIFGSSDIMDVVMFKAATYLFICSMLFCFNSSANADDCISAAYRLAEHCPTISDGQFNVIPECKFEEAKINFLWASRNNPGASDHFRSIFDSCDSPDASVIEKNIAASIITQMHNMTAMCSISNCKYGDLQGFLLIERSQHRLYEGRPAESSGSTNICGMGYFLSEGRCWPTTDLLVGRSGR